MCESWYYKQSIFYHVVKVVIKLFEHTFWSIPLQWHRAFRDLSCIPLLYRLPVDPL